MNIVPLSLHMESCATREEMNANVRASVARGYEPINGHLMAYKGSVSVVGAGPSIERSWRTLTGDVLAINSALGFLLSKGVVPRFHMVWDASPLCARFIVPHPEVTYLIGARCHPLVFDALKCCRVVCWHAGGDHNIAELLEELSLVEPMVNGGSAGVTRALYLVAALGYRDIHVHGGDSSYSEDGRTHVRGSVVEEKDLEILVGAENPVRFRTTPEWCAQVEEFKQIMLGFEREGMTMTVHGDGMLPYVWRVLRADLDKQCDARLAA